MLQGLRKIIHILIGMLLLLLGLLGLALPVLNGTIFLIIGFIILSFESPYIERKLLFLTEKNPTLHKWYTKLNRILRKVFRK